jgi:hypothetical protein
VQHAVAAYLSRRTANATKISDVDDDAALKAKTVGGAAADSAAATIVAVDVQVEQPQSPA